MKFLGIDIGTGGSRAILIDAQGHVLACESVAHEPFASPQIGWAEQSPDDWWRAASDAVRRVIGAAGIDSGEIAAVGLSGQMHGAVLLDERDRVVRPALIWCDQRTEAQCRRITATIGAERLLRLVSNPAVAGFTLPKLLWVRDHEPDLWSQVRSVLLPKDYVRLNLTGDKASDVADSSGTLLFDVGARKWSDEMLAGFGIERSLLPAVYESIEFTGTVSAAGAAATGLAAGTPVVAGAGDNAAGAVGLGIVRPGMTSATIGTSGVVFAVSDAPRVDLRGRIHTLCHAVPDRWHNTGVTQAAGLSLKWLRETIAPESTYEGLTELAETVPGGSDGLLWLPYLMGERTPHLDSKARAAFVGLTAGHNRGHLVRAVLEGVAFSLREAFDIFAEAGVELGPVMLGGGGAKSELWRQIQADAYGRAVAVPESDEGAAFGAALLAGVGAGAWTSVDEACARTIRIRETAAPDPAAAAVLERNYKAYRMLYTALRPAILTAAGEEYH